MEQSQLARFRLLQQANQVCCYIPLMIDNDELLFIVDENNGPLEPKSRRETHDKGLWHRIAHIWIVNDRGELLCQQRTLLKDKNPGKWEAHFGGHVLDGQEYIENAVREIQEELGLKIDKKDMTLLMIYKCDKDREFQAVFTIKWNGNIEELNPEKEEVEKIKWLNISEIEEFYKRKDNQWADHGYEGKALQAIRKREN